MGTFVSDYTNAFAVVIGEKGAGMVLEESAGG